MCEEFIKQTAKDFDISLERTRKIIENNPTNFYEKLEEYLVERRNR